MILKHPYFSYLHKQKTHSISLTASTLILYLIARKLPKFSTPVVTNCILSVQGLQWDLHCEIQWSFPVSTLLFLAFLVLLTSPSLLWIRTPHCHVFPFFSWFCYSYLWPLSFGMCQDSLFCPLSTFTPLMMFPNNLTLKILKICIKFMSSHSLSSEICTHKSSCLCKLSIGVANRHLEHICSRLSLWYSSPNLFHAQFSPSQWLHLHPFLLLGPKILRSSLSLSFTPHIQHTMKSYWLVKMYSEFHSLHHLYCFLFRASCLDCSSSLLKQLLDYALAPQHLQTKQTEWSF